MTAHQNSQHHDLKPKSIFEFVSPILFRYKLHEELHSLIYKRYTFFVFVFFNAIGERSKRWLHRSNYCYTFRNAFRNAATYVDLGYQPMKKYSFDLVIIKSKPHKLQETVPSVTTVEGFDSKRKNFA